MPILVAGASASAPAALDELAKRSLNCVQIDEPFLVLELPQAWHEAYRDTYQTLAGQAKPMLISICDSIRHQRDIITALPIQGLTCGSGGARRRVDRSALKIASGVGVIHDVTNGRIARRFTELV